MLIGATASPSCGTRSQIEAEEALRGRSLADAEAAAMLKRFGRPIRVAADYGASDYLIGPTLFPSS